MRLGGVVSIAVLISRPSACDTRREGIVIVGSIPASGCGGVLGALSAMTTALAPANCAFFTFTMNEQVPRSITAILPLTALALAASSGVQARPSPLAWST